MGDSQNVDRVVANKKGNVIGEPAHRRSSNVEALGESFDACPCSWPMRDRLDRDIDGIEEHGAETGPRVFVPARCIGKLCRSVGAQSDRPSHPLR